MTKYGDPYSEFVLCNHPIQVHTYSSEHTHTHTHTLGAVGIYAAAPGEQLGFGALLKDTSVSRGIESAEHSLPPRQFLPARDSNPQPLDYEPLTL